MWKDNSIISIDVKDKSTGRKIRVLDSLLQLKVSLKYLLKSFNCQINKGIFTCSFLINERLWYICCKEEYFYYENKYRKI